MELPPSSKHRLKRPLQGLQSLIAFSFDIRQVQWMKLEETLSSDHYIVGSITRRQKTPVKMGQAKITYWTAFTDHEVRGIQDIEKWTKHDIDTLVKHTKAETQHLPS
ncbi:hypothetical protein HPB50_029309 [Hyalomma asiaticum]|nr:hypothetical protein HPB50_029309 [Hyalomma asiaticum]